MKKEYYIIQERNHEKGGDDLSHLIATVETREEAARIVNEHAASRLKKFAVQEAEIFKSGSKRVMTIWEGWGSCMVCKMK